MLKLENLTVKVAGKEILTNINLEIKDGEKMALLGRNGSGSNCQGIFRYDDNGPTPSAATRGG